MFWTNTWKMAQKKTMSQTPRSKVMNILATSAAGTEEVEILARAAAPLRAALVALRPVPGSYFVRIFPLASAPAPSDTPIFRVGAIFLLEKNGKKYIRKTYPFESTEIEK